MNHFLSQTLHLLVSLAGVGNADLFARAICVTILETLSGLSHDLPSRVGPVEHLQDAGVHLARVGALRLRVVFEAPLERMHIRRELQQIKRLPARRHELFDH